MPRHLYFLICWICFSTALLGQTRPLSFMETQLASIARQRTAISAPVSAPGITKQVASVRRQRAVATPVPPSEFYAIPWPSPPAMPAAAFDRVPCSPLPPGQIGLLTERAALLSGVRSEILQAVILQESTGRPCAVSAKGASGLMQLMPATAALFGVEDPFNPDENVEAGSLFLRRLLNRYAGDLSLALAAYNAGPGAVDRAGGIPDFPETRNYVRSVLDRAGMTGAMLSESPGLQTLPSSVPRGALREPR